MRYERNIKTNNYLKTEKGDFVVAAKNGLSPTPPPRGWG